jgi:hypothetical protein
VKLKTNVFFVVALLAGASGQLAAQATGTPSFNAPYRAFSQHEFGATVSFPRGADIGLEGQYRFGYDRFDVGLRGGFVSSGITTVIVGAEARTRMITHTEDFPVDGALIVGIGGTFNSFVNSAIIIGGLSLGRRIDPKDSQVSIIPYVEPTLFIVSGGGGTNVGFAFGLGADFRLSKLIDARVGVGLGDIQGISFSAVWIH